MTNAPLGRRLTAVAALALLGLGNLWLLASTAPPAYVVAETQYQSLLLSVASAVHYDETGDLLIVERAPDPPQRVEFLSADDLGYPLLLSGLVKVGLVEFGEETRALVSTRWEPDVGRAHMIGPLLPEVQNLNRVAFALVGLVSTVVLLLWRATSRSRDLAGLDTFAFAVFVVTQVAPHLLPQLFAERLHQHGLVPALALAAFVAILLAIAEVYHRSVHGFDSRRGWATSALLCAAAGGTVGVVAIIRRSEGLVWLAAATVVSLAAVAWAFRQRDRIRAVIAVAALGAFVMGFVVPDVAVGRIVERRDTVVLEVADDALVPGHPVYHSLLLAIAQANTNVLGATNGRTVVERVREETGFRGNAYSPGYEEASRDVFWQYVRDHPRNYVRVLLDNIDRTTRQVGERYDVSLSASSWLPALLAAVAAIGLIARRGLRGSTSDRILVGLATLTMAGSSLLALATPAPGSFGPAALLLVFAVISIGFGLERFFGHDRRNSLDW